LSACTSRAGRRALGVVTAASLLTAGSAGLAPAATAAPADPAAATQTAVKKPVKGDKLRGSERAKLARAVAEGAPTVTVMVVASRGEVARARNEVRRLGGTIRYAADELGYFSAVVPTDQVEATVALPSVEALDLDEVVPLPEVRPDQPGPRQPAVTGGPSAATADDNPFMPTRETGSIVFKRQHPTWDGRGTTIGILDSGVDLAHPALQRTSTGERKIVDTFTATSPLEGDGTWLKMTGGVPATGYTVPAGDWRFADFAEVRTNIAGGEVLGDVNRDGDRADVWGVLYDPKSKDVVVDVDGDKDFTDEEVRRPYREKQQVGTFGKDSTATEVVDAMPFTVDSRTVNGTDYVDIGIVSGAHGSHVAGITAAHSMFGGAMDGQAPGAKLVSARACTFGPGCTAAALTDGMAELAVNRGVDVINMSIGGLPALNDGDNARAALYNRIIADGVQLVISAGNSGNALNTIGDPSVATDVISVGASISKATWKANYGSDVTFAHGMLTFSSGGPREDGGFKPNVTAPGSAISTTPTWQAGGPVTEAGYRLPPGYAMFNGTSMASPQAAGVVSLLLSAAEAEGRKAPEPASLRSALYGTAVYDPSIPAFLQGHGEVDVVGAYAALKRAPAPDTFTVSAPVCTEVWKILGKTTGTGLYNRCAPGAGGQAAGEARTYDVTVTRTSGGKASGSYAVSLIGDDGTFSVSPATVTLPLGQPVKVKVTATPAAGAHTALLRIDDSKTLGVDSSTMLAVVAGTTLDAPTYTSTTKGTSSRNATTRTYVTVPVGTKALQVTLGGLARDAQTRFLAFHPFGLPIDSTASTACYSNRGTDTTCNSAKRVYANPQPGVWELLVESRRTSPLASTPFELSASLLGVTVDPATKTVPTVATGAPAQLTWDVRNDFGTVTGQGVGGNLGSALQDTKQIADGEEQTFIVEVPEGADRLDVKIGGTSDAGADLDLYVSGPSGTRSSADGDSEEAVTFLAPKHGRYTVTVDGYDVPDDTTSYAYLDAFTSAALGSLEVTSPAGTLASGQATTVTGTLTAATAATTGRSLFGEMRFLSDGGALLGTGSVKVGAVTAP
jgi:subtilisin family serine protease